MNKFRHQARRDRRKPQVFDTMTADEYRATAAEAQIQEAICELLDLAGIPYSVTDASRAFGQDGKARRSKVRTGWPDISAVWRGGIALFIETKSASGKVSLAQRATHEALRDAGAIVLVPRSVEEVEEFLNAGLSGRVIGVKTETGEEERHKV